MIGVIADDLTGAAELGAIGWRHGLRAEIVRSGKPGGTADLVCVDTDSRACEPDVAAKRAAGAAKLLRAAGAKWIYKKVDSVLRGQVTAEVEAVMKQLKLTRALLLPANPSLGRTIRGGEYFLHGKPLHKTEFAHDPHFPRRSSQVLRLVKELVLRAWERRKAEVGTEAIDAERKTKTIQQKLDRLLANPSFSVANPKG